MTRRYMSSRERTALFGIGTHRSELQEFISENLKKEGINIKPEDIKINPSDTILEAGNNRYQIFKSKDEFEKSLAQEYQKYWSNYLIELENKKRITGIYDFGINAIKNVLKKMIADTVVSSIHLKFEKSLANKFKFGSSEFYLKEIKKD